MRRKAQSLWRGIGRVLVSRWAVACARFDGPQAAQVVHLAADRRLREHPRVSRKLAAEMNESVHSDASVMPSSSLWPLAGFLPSDPAGILSFAMRVLVDADGRGYAFNRVTNQLFLVDGLR